MDYLQTITLSVIEGITEFLPISSTGHLVLASNLLGLRQTEFVKSFEIIIQLGAILAVAALYWKTLLKNIEVWKRVIIAFLPSAILGFILYRLIKDILIGNTIITLLTLFIGGIILIFFEKFYQSGSQKLNKIESLPFDRTFLVGIFQSISMVPGISRAAATIIGGLIIGFSRKTAVEFSFLLAIPTMLAATALDLTRNSFKFSSSELSSLVVGFIASFLVAWLTVKIFLAYIQKHTFIFFGFYRIILSVIYWLIIIK